MQHLVLDMIITNGVSGDIFLDEAFFPSYKVPLAMRYRESKNQDGSWKLLSLEHSVQQLFFFVDKFLLFVEFVLHRQVLIISCHRKTSNVSQKIQVPVSLPAF